MTITVFLDWPSHDLSPNARLHWRRKAPLVKQARWAAKVATLEQAGGAKLPPGAPLSVSLLFCRPLKGKRWDSDNVVAALKSAGDGVADALGFDDRQIVERHDAWGEPCDGGRVELRLDVVAR